MVSQILRERKMTDENEPVPISSHEQFTITAGGVTLIKIMGGYKLNIVPPPNASSQTKTEDARLEDIIIKDRFV